MQKGLTANVSRHFIFVPEALHNSDYFHENVLRNSHDFSVYNYIAYFFPYTFLLPVCKQFNLKYQVHRYNQNKVHH